MKQTFNPCDECEYSYSKQNQDSGMCKICEFKKFIILDRQRKLLILPVPIGTLVYELYQFMGEGTCEIDVHKIRIEDLEKIDKTVFLTKEEAEAALKEMRERK